MSKKCPWCNSENNHQFLKLKDYFLTQEEFASLMAYIRDNNIKAFITASNCSEIYGLWLKHRKRHGRIEISNE